MPSGFIKMPAFAHKYARFFSGADIKIVVVKKRLKKNWQEPSRFNCCWGSLQLVRKKKKGKNLKKKNDGRRGLFEKKNVTRK